MARFFALVSTVALGIIAAATVFLVTVGSPRATSALAVLALALLVWWATASRQVRR